MYIYSSPFSKDLLILLEEPEMDTLKVILAHYYNSRSMVKSTKDFAQGLIARINYARNNQEQHLPDCDCGTCLKKGSSAPY